MPTISGYGYSFVFYYGLLYRVVGLVLRSIIVTYPSQYRAMVASYLSVRYRFVCAVYDYVRADFLCLFVGYGYFSGCQTYYLFFERVAYSRLYSGLYVIGGSYLGYSFGYFCVSVIVYRECLCFVGRFVYRFFSFVEGRG